MLVPTPVYHITHLRNLAGIIAAGGLRCHRHLCAQSTQYTDIAHRNIQDRRADTPVPCGPGGNLHDYVPLYFAPRSPMLYAISRGNVEGYAGGQKPVAHLVTTAQAIAAAGCGFVFTDGHAVVSVTGFHDDLGRLGAIDWPLMQETYWYDTDDDNDRKRRRQAEFLVHQSLPWELVTEIGVLDKGVQCEVAKELGQIKHCPRISVRPEWYYDP